MKKCVENILHCERKKLLSAPEYKRYKDNQPQIGKLKVCLKEIPC